ncbi:vWA domain-containing protein [Chitinophaga filiformis]|uniref:VWA domain-containing protein n=1 Tax=Chitinophaga filiformis TaxID=104663 RepID=A0ABY4HX65_CHIFI|nr:vWA domain-containing protein [Chitinophaga filiformis]UPK67634.1 VWA domain-containing protein [Chitinophaga filiformis]
MSQRILFPILTIVGASLFTSNFNPYTQKNSITDRRSITVPADTALDKVQDKRNTTQAKIQIVFALDATGSMSGLIGAAKEKIWSIAGSLAQAEPAPVIEMGLLFYRDKGDVFVTRKVALSSDIDDVYAKLMQIAAEGGGDEPESVNQALYEAVTKFSWDTAYNTYKTVFLVGDRAPHMDYQDDIKYPVSCGLAKKRDIVLNTILMGNDSKAMRIWKEIAACNQGSYAQVGMDANDIEVNTPYDEAIADLSDKLDNTRIYYGSAKEKSAAYEKVSNSKIIASGTKANVKAQRAEYNSTKAGKVAYYGQKELLESYKDKSVSLDSIKEEELPDLIKNMTAAQRKVFLEQKIAERDSLNRELVKFTKQRQEYIEKDLKSREAASVDSSFTNRIYKSIQKQTEKKNIHLKANAKF